nr:DMT family transporter [uncultured Shimia sp.]
MQENLRGSLWMMAAMAGFAIEDTMIKLAARDLPVGEILMIFGAGGMLGFLCLTWQRGERAIVPEIITPIVCLRALSEVIGRLFFTLSLAFTALSSTSAILQATPLVVTLGAALFFRERVGARRWVAIFIGLLGVLLILRPAPSLFEPASLLAVIGMLGFAGRDLATRGAPATLSHMQLGIYGFFVMIPTGLMLLLWEGRARWPSLDQWGWLGGAIFFGIGAYYALTSAMRLGDVSVVTPFRYTRLVFALVLATLIFGETPDILTLAGALIVVASGLYTLMTARPKAA